MAMPQFNIFFLLFFLFHASKSTCGFTLNLIPWDSIESPLYQPNLTQTQKIQMMAITSKQRASSSPTLNNSKMQIPITNIGLLYTVDVRIGSQQRTLFLDTSAALIFKRCDSNAQKKMSYQHPMCQHNSRICKGMDGQCVCIVHARARQVKAALWTDSLSLPLKNNGFRTFPNIVFGCTTTAFPRILGMSRSSLSFISQVKENVQGRFSYCLHKGNGHLTFGQDVPRITRNFQHISILYPLNPLMFVELRGISVGRTILNTFPLLNRDLLIDTGAPFTVLKTQVYRKVIQEFEKFYDGKLTPLHVENYYHLELCYVAKRSFRDYATMTFHLPRATYVTSNLYFFPTPEIVCIGLLPGEVSILGAMQQWNKRIIFDLKWNVMQFADEDCKRD